MADLEKLKFIANNGCSRISCDKCPKLLKSMCDDENVSSNMLITEMAEKCLKELENNVCKWQYASGVTAIQCGAKIFNGATGKSLGFIYCPFCGKKIEYSA
jgi:hypothetical protein